MDKMDYMVYIYSMPLWFEVGEVNDLFAGDMEAEQEQKFFSGVAPLAWEGSVR